MYGIRPYLSFTLNLRYIHVVTVNMPVPWDIYRLVNDDHVGKQVEVPNGMDSYMLFYVKYWYTFEN